MSIVFIILVSTIVLGVVILGAWLYWRAGASQSYVHSDGTITEWDRFGNLIIVHPDGRTEMHIEEPGKGLGPLMQIHSEMRGV